ncbi:MAG TPA: nuclear transport factor 2 family protein [Sphingobium sp.]
MTASSESTAEANKQLVLKAAQELFVNLDITAIDRYWGDSYVQHNPLYPDGKEQIRAVIQSAIDSGVPINAEVKRVAADGDLVWIHAKSFFFGKELATVEIFRVENGKIVEHWDVIQEVPAESANNNTMF